MLEKIKSLVINRVKNCVYYFEYINLYRTKKIEIIEHIDMFIVNVINIRDMHLQKLKSIHILEISLVNGTYNIRSMCLQKLKLTNILERSLINGTSNIRYYYIAFDHLVFLVYNTSLLWMST